VLGLGLPEVPDRGDLGDDLPRPQAGGLHVGDRVLGDLLLLVARVEDRRAVAQAHVVALAVERRRVVDLEEELQQCPERGRRRIEDDLDGLRVGAVVAVGRIRRVTARVPDARGKHPGEAADQVLHAPEAAPREDCPLCRVRHVHTPRSRWPPTRVHAGRAGCSSLTLRSVAPRTASGRGGRQAGTRRAGAPRRRPHFSQGLICLRALCSRDFTVPSGMPMRSTISA
jgi:hypothetical protein